MPYLEAVEKWNSRQAPNSKKITQIMLYLDFDVLVDFTAKSVVFVQKISTLLYA